MGQTDTPTSHYKPMPNREEIAVSINAPLSALVDGLAAGGVADPLAESLTLAYVWADLARLARAIVPLAAVDQSGSLAQDGRLPHVRCAMFGMLKGETR